MIKRNTNRLTIYRRHAESCRFYKQPVRRAAPSRTGITVRDEGCECPFWIHGRLRGELKRESLHTISVITAKLKADAMIEGRPDPDGPQDGIALASPKPAADMTFAEAALEYLKSKTTPQDLVPGKANGKKKRKQVGSSSLTLYTRALKHFGAWAEAHSLVLLSQIETKQIEDYFADYDGDWMATTAQSRLQHLRVFFNWCVKQGYIQQAPTRDSDLNYDTEADEDDQRLPLKPEEVARILAAVEEMPEEVRDRARALVLLLLHTGMRISDATFFERAYLETDAERTVANYWVIKTRKRIELPPTLWPVLLDALAKLPGSRVYFFQLDRDDDYKLARTALRHKQEFASRMPDYDARVREATSLVVKVMRRAGIDTGSCHRFRDTFAVEALTSGVSLDAVSMMLGHSDMKITKKHYLKFIPGYRERLSDETAKLRYIFPQPVAA